MAQENGQDRSSYEKLKTMILERAILPGQRLTEVFLAEKMELSRIPVREAIQQLLHEGFIERTGKNGYQIKEYSAQDIIDLYNFREAMDGMLARLFSQRMDDSELYYLEMNVETMRECLDAIDTEDVNTIDNFDQAEFSKIDIEFHMIIANGARNRHMEHQHEIILEKVIYVAAAMYEINKRKEKKLLTLESYEKTYSQHCAIFEAIKGGNPDAAEKAARESVQSGLKKALMIHSRRH